MMDVVDGGDSADDLTPDRPERGVGGGGGAADAARDIESANSIRAGTLLLASTDLLEPTFARTVIYVIEHNDAGSLGVVLNRVSQTAVHNVMPSWTDLAAQPRALFVGGPVKQDSALCLGVVRRGADISGIEQIRPVSGRVALIDLDADPELIGPVLEGLRIFAGYAGWGIGQLDAEMAQDSWMLASALPRDILAPSTTDIWADVLRRQPWPLPLLATHPVDVTGN
ncbi:YqgE/AlgH family protein [uncultured Gordonia sp.]|uniref:YqgE/AlgH family protein n=1 Tax=uncultured Gordonia sp. TaxID=198437 RepID=UPI00258D81DE|nr:YqgE/AlgH family protein [uncultured Gordonia sp.]